MNFAARPRGEAIENERLFVKRQTPFGKGCIANEDFVDMRDPGHSSNKRIPANQMHEAIEACKRSLSLQ